MLDSWQTTCNGFIGQVLVAIVNFAIVKLGQKWNTPPS